MESALNFKKFHGLFLKALEINMAVSQDMIFKKMYFILLRPHCATMLIRAIMHMAKRRITLYFSYKLSS